MATTEVKLHIRTWAEAESSESRVDELGYGGPTIELNGKALPTPEGGSKGNHGFQVVAIDAAAEDMTDPGSILLNEYHYLPKVRGALGHYEPKHYERMYRQMIHALLGAGDPGCQRVFIVGYGLDARTAPPVEACKYLIGLGAGPKLQEWASTSWAEGWSDYYIEYPACYVLIGASGFGYGQGVEAYAGSTWRQWSKTDQRLELNVTLQNTPPAPRRPHPAHAPGSVGVT